MIVLIIIIVATISGGKPNNVQIVISAVKPPLGIEPMTTPTNNAPPIIAKKFGKVAMS